jgi:PII-like signaling protein
MSLKGEGKLLRIFIGESDRWDHKPLYEEIVQLARRKHMAGATVIRGIEGFGAHSRLHTARILRLSEDLPLVIELVDTVEKIDSFLEEIDHMIEGGMVTSERVEIRKYQAEETKEA